MLVRVHIDDGVTASRKPRHGRSPRAGTWPHIWRCAGKYSNLSVLDVENNERSHEVLWNLPLFPYMTIEITPLATHPCDIAAES